MILYDTVGYCCFFSFSRFIACSMMLVSKYSSGNIISSVCSDKCVTPVLVNGIILNSNNNSNSIDENSNSNSNNSNNIGLKSFNNKLANGRISSDHSIQYLSGVTTSSNTTITFPISEISIKSESIHEKEVFIKDDTYDGLDGILRKAKEMMGEEEFYELVECNEYNEYNTIRDKIVLDTIRSEVIDLESLVSNGITVLGDSERDRLERVVWYDVDDGIVTDTDTVLYCPIERPIRPVTCRKRDYIRKWFKWW